MTGALLDQVQPEPRFDRFGRYLLPHPDGGGGSVVPWTRATTWAKTLSDMFGLARWQCRMVAKGIATRPDLYALAAATLVEDRKTLDQVVEDAKEAAAASSGANLGTALHGFTERLDRGEDPAVPAPWDRDVAAYAAALDAAGVVVDRGFIERVVVVPELRVAGKIDRIMTAPGLGRVIGDVKTGKDLSYGWGEIAIQLAIYAHAAAVWNGITSRYEPMPPVDQDQALVVHLPVGQQRCELHVVDIAAGWDAAQLAGTVRRWRARTNLASPLVPSSDSARPDLLARIRTARDESELLALWQTADTKGRWSAAHTEAARTRKTQLTRT